MKVYIDNDKKIVTSNHCNVASSIEDNNDTNYDYQILDRLCHNLNEKKKNNNNNNNNINNNNNNDNNNNDDDEFRYWFLIKIIPYNLLVLVINIIFLIVVIITIFITNKEVDDNVMIDNFEIIEWIVLSLMSITTFTYLYLVSVNNNKHENISKKHLIHIWNQMSIGIIFVRVITIILKILHATKDTQIFRIESNSVKFVNNSRANENNLQIIFTSVLVTIIQISFWLMCFATRSQFVLFTTIEQAYIFLKIESYNDSFFNKPFFVKWLASAWYGLPSSSILITFIISINYLYHQYYLPLSSISSSLLQSWVSSHLLYNHNKYTNSIHLLCSKVMGPN